MPNRRDRRAPASIDSWIRVGLVVAAFGPFIATLFYGFVYDDKAIILHNPVIDGWRSLAEVWKHPYWPQGASGLYRPLLLTLFAVIWNGAHKFAIAFHLAALAAHAIATLLVAKLLRRAVGRWPAALGALWFALAPVHVEAVANTSNVSEVLVCIWTVLMVLVLIPASGESQPEAPGWGRAALAAALYAAALLSKESGAVAPGLALLAVAAWRSATPTRPRALLTSSRGWLRVVALWIVVLACVIVVRSVVLHGVVGTESLAVPGLAGLNTGQRMIAALSLGGRIVQLLLWPTMQSPDYGPSALATSSERVMLAVITIAAIVAVLGTCVWLATRARRPDSRPLAAIGWCLLGFLPASNLLAATGAVLAERTLYVSSAGVAMLVAWCLDVLLEAGHARRQPLSNVRGQLVPIAASLAIAIACARGYFQTRGYAKVWRNNAAIVAQMVRADSLNYRGYQLLAFDARERRRYGEAAALYARAYALVPFDPGLSLEYGEFLLDTNRPRYALAIGQRVLRHAELWTNPHAVTLLLNATARAWGVDSVLAAAARLNTRAPSARAALFVGIAYEARGDTTAANAAYRAGLRLSPGDSALSARTLRLSNQHE